MQATQHDTPDISTGGGWPIAADHWGVASQAR
jgi:hypothetical protein